MNEKIGRNDPCSCGSGSKFKNCYEKESPYCKIYEDERRKKLLSEHNHKEKRIFSFLKNCGEELKLLFSLKNVPIRVLTINCFTLVDVLASYWFIYLNKDTNRHRDKFLEFVEEFCLCKDNNEYTKFKKFKRITAQELYGLRCSSVHFYGLGGDRFILVPIKDPEEIKEKIEDLRRKLINKVKKEKNRDLVPINPADLRELILDGAVLMLNRMKKNVTKSAHNSKIAWEHIEGIDRIYKKYKREGAVSVPFPNTESKTPL